MHYALSDRTVTLSVGEFANFSLGPSEDGGGAPGLWRAQLGQHWHNELQKRTLAEAPDALFEVPIEGRVTHRGWTFALHGRIDQFLPAPPVCRPEGVISDRLSVIGSGAHPLPTFRAPGLENAGQTPGRQQPATVPPHNRHPITNNLRPGGPVIREIKSVLRPLPADEAELRADYPSYFLQLATYVVLQRAAVPISDLPSPLSARASAPAALRAELVFVEAGAGLVQTVLLTPFDEALVFHQLDAIVEFLSQQLRAAERRHHLHFHSPFTALRPGQETIQGDLLAALGGQQVGVKGYELGVKSPPDQEPLTNDSSAVRRSSQPSDLRPAAEIVKSSIENRVSKIVLLEAPTGYGKTGCVLEFALNQLKAGRYDRLIWLTGKSTGQIQVMHTLAQMRATPPSARSEAQSEQGTSPSIDPQVSGFRSQVSPLPAWQVRNKAEHCVNHEFHCVRDSCDYLRGVADRWPGSGLSRFYTDEQQPRDLDALRDAGRRALVCPYEITRAALPFNDVWIGDFNYVFAPDNRGVFFEQPGFDPARTLLVVDEAHNLPSRVAGAYSLTAFESDARLLLAELDHLRAPPPLVLAVGEWARLLGSLESAESLDPLVEADVRDQLARLAQLATNTPLDYAALGPHHSETLWSFVSLHTWLGEAQLGCAQVKGYELGVKRSADPTLNQEHPTPNAGRERPALLWIPRSGQLEFTCLDAAAEIGATLREFGGAILMSATLQPYAEFAESCGLPATSVQPQVSGLRFQVSGSPLTAPKPGETESAPSSSRFTPVRSTLHPSPLALGPSPYTTLHAPTPWRAGAYDVAVDLRVDTTFRHRASHYRDTAATIVALASAAAAASAAKREAPSAKRTDPASPLSLGSLHTAMRCVAVFFPSYAYAEAVQKTLDDYGSVLRVALQPKLPDLAAQTAWVEENLALSDVLFLVLGSSFAEGIDLLGGRVTHAMVVGPALPEVNAVQKSRMRGIAALDHLGREAAFRRVYQIPGLQKVNQALGRLVRAPGQHAKVLLHCRRFADPSYSSLLAADYQFYREIADEAELKEWLGAKR